jgi:transcriptional regulator with XRE-family HTH domain
VEHAKDWPASVAKRVGERVAFFRAQATDERGRKLTAQALADRCGELGLPLGRPTIAKLEKGLRETITVGEVQILAKALDVSPADLVFPIGQAAEVEVLPGQHVDTWDAVQWFSGFADRPGVPADDGAGLVHLYQLHHVILQEWPKPFQGWVDDPGHEAYRNAWAASERMAVASLRTVRATMRERGLVLPTLPPHLAYVDNGEPGE